MAGDEFDEEWFDLIVGCCWKKCIINVWLQAVEAGVLDDSREKSVIPTSLEDEIAIIRRECSVNCTNDIVKLLDERIALQLEELDFEIREEGNKTNLYKMKDEYKIDFELLSEDTNNIALFSCNSCTVRKILPIFAVPFGRISTSSIGRYGSS